MTDSPDDEAALRAALKIAEREGHRAAAAGLRRALGINNRGGDQHRPAREARDALLRDIASCERGKTVAEIADHVLLKLRGNAQLRAQVLKTGDGLKLPGQKRLRAILLNKQ